jgi:hypothetical protein
MHYYSQYSHGTVDIYKGHNGKLTIEQSTGFLVELDFAQACALKIALEEFISESKEPVTILTGWEIRLPKDNVEGV